MNCLKGIALLIILFFVLFLFIIMNKNHGVHHVRNNLITFDVESTPYDGAIEFELNTDDILAGRKQPEKITSIYQTDIYLAEIYEKINSINEDEEVHIVIGFESKFKSPEGKMVSLHEIWPDGRTNSGLVNVAAFNQGGDPGVFGAGSGDHEGRFEQAVSYFFTKEEINKSYKWRFSISDFFILHYKEK
ncbi:hypothetical protein ACWE42_10010 [Sutcliffiella cohnii]